jgi:hypothetical protein
LTNSIWLSGYLRIWVGLMRRFPLQFHLSTAVLLTLTAGLLLWLNFRPASAWGRSVVVVKQVRPLQGVATDQSPQGGRGEDVSAPDSRVERLLQPVEFMDFRLGGLFRTTYGWPLPAWTHSCELLPMVCVQPVEVPDAWRRQAIESGQADLAFTVDGEEAERLFGDASRNFGTTDGMPPPDLVSASDRELNIGGVVANAFAAIGILFAVAICSEWLQRRKDRGRSTQAD